MKREVKMIIRTLRNFIGDYAHEEIADDRTYFCIYDKENRHINMCSFEKEAREFLEERESDYVGK